MESMEVQNKQGVGKFAATWGLILGVGIILLLTVDYVLGYYQSKTWYNLLTYVLFIGVTFMAMKTYRDKLNGGYITYGKAFIVGLLTSVFASIIAGVYFVVLAKLIAPDYVTHMMEAAMQKLVESGMYSEEVMEQSMSMMEKMGILFAFFGILFGYAFWGAVISLIVAIFVKRKNPAQQGY